MDGLEDTDSCCKACKATDHVHSGHLRHRNVAPVRHLLFQDGAGNSDPGPRFWRCHTQPLQNFSPSIGRQHGTLQSLHSEAVWGFSALTGCLPFGLLDTSLDLRYFLMLLVLLTEPPTYKGFWQSNRAPANLILTSPYRMQARH